MTRPLAYVCPVSGCGRRIEATVGGADALSALERHVKDAHGPKVPKLAPCNVASQVQAATNAVATGAQGGLR